jgi:hypothetical protein
VSPVGLQLGAPGVYRSDPASHPAFAPVRLDVAGFVGVAPRGPVDQPVPVESWSDYLWTFGDSQSGPGGLGASVHSFFAQGGLRALVLRVSPLPRAPDPEALLARAAYDIAVAAPGARGDSRPDVLHLQASSEGKWGTQLRVQWRFEAGQDFRTSAFGTELTLPRGVVVPPDSLLRVWLLGQPALRWVEEVRDREGLPGERVRYAVLDAPLPGRPPGELVEVDVVTATLTVTDRATDVARSESRRGLGLGRAHPGFAAQAVTDFFRLVEPVGRWPERIVPPDPLLGAMAVTRSREGRDRFTQISAESFVGSMDPGLLPVGGTEPLDPHLVVHGVDRMSLEPEIGLLCVPDLLWDSVIEPTPPEQPRRPRKRCDPCAPCPDEPRLTFEPPEPRSVLLEGPGELDQALSRQRRVVSLADRQRRFVALLDVPGRLGVRAVSRWRAAIDSSYAAAYLPWLGTVPEGLGGRGELRPLAPSAVAAGIIAGREHRLGLPWGPAGEVAVDAVTSGPVTDAEHDELHPLGVNVFRAERDGFRLTAARTLSRDPDYQQLSVRRLMTMLALTLEQQGQWVAFEPNTADLRRELAWLITQLLRDLFRDGAFAGQSEAEAFFVRCDDSVNPPWELEQGRLVAEVGVAPASPLEFIVLRLARDANGAVGVEG